LNVSFGRIRPKVTSMPFDSVWRFRGILPPPE
jgi:hypothetical protein